ncbi:hypothetical protein FYJ45_28030 [Eisenbergiella tayi]|uniref:Uncharacterized protein n=1 Tax=Eisenbergiella porci TaxID=2652274 RepID=A0A6N7W9H9_9FIRM|nr:hypothetical protein [Eisenbergiella porci]MSS91919.1 hypothetical protein [Eisenbergiella porci]
MKHTWKHLSLLSRMKGDGLALALTSDFSEGAIEQACEGVERFHLQEQLRDRQTLRIQKELVQIPEFAALYHALCEQETDDDKIVPMLQSADACGERLTAYPQTQVLETAKLDLLPSLRFEYMKYYLPFVKYEEEEQIILENLQSFPVAEWESLSTLTENQRDMMRLPFLGEYLFYWYQTEREALAVRKKLIPLLRLGVI